MSLKHHVLFPLLSAQTVAAGAKNASPRCHEGVTNEFDWRWSVLALRIRRLIPDYGNFDLQLCDQLFDVVKELGLAEKVSSDCHCLGSRGIPGKSRVLCKLVLLLPCLQTSAIVAMPQHVLCASLVK